MIIERITDNSITISLSKDIDLFGIQRLIDYARYLEAISQSKAKQSEIDKLADEVNEDWWERNKSRFI
ncbi:hypothetical protein [uncultured Proteiniphilum sp.]|uniref:hypothetical protein n=1 Tax=uncultured Proteiniphilum sp. TaxID=497637 RepID=UPI00260BB902|nr:hypothetical protein [uncultured Proteiniphilum sp.]